ncbi:MAG: crosslink repair DNA glycosylase YcaQ family protein [Pseudomonadota bacterium]
MTLDTLPSISRDEARRIALAAQGFTSASARTPPGWARMRGMIDRLGLLQIDSVNVCVRSHYLPLFSRLGPYSIERLDAALLTPRPSSRRHFEYWAHEASFLPLDLHTALRWRMADARRGIGIYRMCAEVAQERPDIVREVRERIASEGPLPTRAFSSPRTGAPEIFDWQAGKCALEYLFWTGELTSAGRRSFERVYDLTERVLPADILSACDLERADAHAALTARAAHAYGIATAADLRDYFRLPAAGFAATIDRLVEEGTLTAVMVEGWDQPAYLARDAAQPRRMTPTALLTPFDPLVWFRARAQRLFDFDYKIEIYTPAEKRQYGYYSLPFMHRGRLVARVDLKAERSGRVLEVRSAHAEPGCDLPTVAEALAGTLEVFAAWLGLERIEVFERGDLTPLLRKNVR